MQSKLGRVATAAVISGTAEELSGGKFSNGAVTGSFVVMFNDLMHETKIDKNNQDEWPSTSELEKDFAQSFENKVMDGYINNEYYNPTDPESVAQDLLYSGYLSSEKHGFELAPIEMRLKAYKDNQVIFNEAFKAEPYYNNGLPTVIDPGYKAPIYFERNNINYKFTIKYQIRLPL